MEMEREEGRSAGDAFAACANHLLGQTPWPSVH